MPKELFNQPLITTPTQPDDNDRIALSTPGATGGKNILWSYFKQLLQGALDKIIFNLGLSNPTYLEGVMFYDDTKKAVSYYNDQPEVTVNLGQEVLIRVYNNSGSLISNGQIVYPTGTFSGVPTIDLADASEKAKCRLVAMATQDIPDSTYGFVTRLGSVGGLNTSALSAGWIYLSDIVPGAWTQTRPTDGSYEIIIGEVGAIHASEGTIIIDPVISQLAVEVTDTNGFPLDQKAATTISFVDGTRTFTIAPTGSEFHYYQTGDKFRHTTGQSVVITDVTGLHIIFFDELVLTAIALPTAAQVEDIVLNKCWVSFVYWNATDAKAIIVNDERHGISMSPAVHIYLHRTRGAQYLEGITPTGYVLGDGSSNTHAQFGFTTGQITDEDNETTLAAVASTTGLRYLYKTGASGIWTYDSNAGYSFPVGGTPLPQFNEFTGGAWQLTEVTSGNFMLLHIFASADITLKPLCVLGTAQYNSAALATAGAPNEIGVILAVLPAPEFVPIATFILECKTSLTNSVNARIVQTSEGEDYINWITQQIGTGSTPANHNNLAGLELAAAGVTWGHIDNQAQTIAGVKTFASSPLVPTPTTDFQAATKKYVDDNIGGGAATSISQGTAYTFLGELLNESFPGVTLNGTNWSGALPTGASVNNKLIIASGLNDWSRYITLVKHYLYEKLEIQVDVTAVTKASGDAWGWHQSSILSLYNEVYYWKFDQYTGILSVGNTDAASNLGYMQPIDFSAGNDLRFTWKRSPGKTIVLIENITTGATAIGEFNICKWGTQGYYRLTFLGGQQEFTNITISSTVRNYGSSDGIVFTGDSITNGTYATTIANRFTNILMRNQQHLFENMGVGAWLSGTLTASRLTELLGSINGKYFICNLGYNDKAQSVSTATYQSNLETIATTAQGVGYTVIFISPWPDRTSSNSSYVTAMQTAATNTSAEFIDISGTVGYVVDDNYISDGVHPNDAGYELMANAIALQGNDFFETLLTDINNEDIKFRNIPYSNEILPFCAINHKGVIVKLNPYKYINKDNIILQPELSSDNLIYRKQTGHIGITGVLYNGNYYLQNPGSSGVGIRIGFNNGIDDTSASNILITNNGTAGLGTKQYFNTISGQKNILIDALNNKGIASGSISGNNNLIINSYIATGITISGANNILLNAYNNLTSGQQNIGLGIAAFKNITTGRNNIIFTHLMDYNGGTYNFSNALTGAIVIGTPFDYTGTTTIGNGDIVISAYTRGARRYIFGAWGGIATSVEWNAGIQRGTNVNAVNLTIKGNSGTGNGSSAPIIFQVVTPGSSGAGIHSYNTQLTISDGSVKVENVFKSGQFTATQASALTPANGDFIYVTDTDATFTSVGFWGYENGVWAKL